MSLEKELNERSGGICELCSSKENTKAFEVTPSNGSINETILVCDVCKEQLETSIISNSNHFRCLNESMWSTIPAVQVVVYRTLTKLSNEAWAQDLLGMLYLEDDVKEWAQKGLENTNEKTALTKDSNGTELLSGDSVTIIKDLDVKGANFVAKRGTLVKNISLTDNPEHIEGRVNGTRIVLLSCFLKKV